MADNNSILEKLEGLESRYEEISTLITDPSVIADQERYVRLTREYKDLDDIMKARKKYIACLSSIKEAKDILANESDPDLKEMAREELQANEELQPKLEEEIKMALVPKDPEDAKNVQMEIRAGTGGDEAALFAGDLFQMYKKFCDSMGWTLSVTSVSEGAVGGYKEIDFAVSGDNVYGTLKYESGVRLRYPWKNPNTGEVEEILIECTETRDQPKNKERALSRLRTFIYDREHQKYIDDIASRRKTLVSTGDRSAKIRTYNFQQGRVTDHRIGYTTHDLQGFLGGDIKDMIDALTVAENAERMKEAEL